VACPGAPPGVVGGGCPPPWWMMAGGGRTHQLCKLIDSRLGWSLPAVAVYEAEVVWVCAESECVVVDSRSGVLCVGGRVSVYPTPLRRCAEVVGCLRTAGAAGAVAAR